MVSEEKKIEILYDHYKDTFGVLLGYLKRRDSLTLIILGFSVFMAFQLSNPEVVSEIISKAIKDNLGDRAEIHFRYVDSIFLLSYFLIIALYLRTIFLIDKTYEYLHNLEDKLSTALAPNEITREGKHYLGYKPLQTDITHHAFSLVFPLMILVVLYLKWHFGCLLSYYEAHPHFFWIDSLVASFTATLTIFYVVSRNGYLAQNLYKWLKLLVTRALSYVSTR